MNIVHAIRVILVLMVTLVVSSFSVAEDTRTVARIAPQGQLKLTIEGPGYFQLQDEQSGEIVYTRSGRFVVNSLGQLAHVGASSRFSITPSISVPSGASSVEVDEEGLVTVIRGSSPDRIPVGKFQLATFDNPKGLSRLSGKRFGETPSSGELKTGEAMDDMFGTIGSGE